MIIPGLPDLTQEVYQGHHMSAIHKPIAYLIKE